MAIRKVGPSEIPSYKEPSRIPSKELKNLVENVRNFASTLTITRFSETKLKMGTEIPYDTDKETTIALKKMFSVKL